MGYDESKENCPEKWLTQEEVYKIVKSDGPEADAIFVALAGGAAFAERDVCEAKLKNWSGAGDGKKKGKFDENAFWKDVQKGRLELGLGWLVFSSLVGISGLNIIAPTNPFEKALEAGIDQFRAAIGTDFIPPP